MHTSKLDLIIIGAGPTGLTCAIEAKKAGLSYLVIEKGGIADSIRRFPHNMTFFSTPDLLELAGLPFSSPNPRPKRIEVLEYYRRVVSYFNLRLALHTRVVDIQQDNGQFRLLSERGESFVCRFLIIATGYFDCTNRLDIPGEDLTHVSHYYDEPFAYTMMDVVIVGGRNSAVEAALDLYRHGAKVTLIHRQTQLGKSVKYWIRPDIDNRIKEGSIKVLFNTVVTAITSEVIHIKNTKTSSIETLKADFVFPLIGYRPDADLLRKAGAVLSPRTLIPHYDSQTFASNVPNLYLAGSVVCGCETWTIFIENGRMHAQAILLDIQKKMS